MKVTLIAAAAFAVLASNADAQACSGPLTARDACRKGVDLTNFVAPQFAEALAGGNLTIAQGGALSGLGHFTVAIRNTEVMGSLPSVGDQGFNTTGETATHYVSKSQLIPALSVDGAFGLWRGVPAGTAHVLGVDALLSATYMSAVDGGSVKAALEGSNTNFGFGARVGIIEETPTMPGISVSYLKRDMPRFSLTGTTFTPSGVLVPGTITISSLLVTTTSMRATIGKRFGAFDITAGGGQDKYEVSATVTGTSVGSSTAAVATEMTRTNFFAGLAGNVGPFKFVGEYGMATGGTAPAMTNDFGEAANKARGYFTLGVRIGF